MSNITTHSALWQLLHGVWGIQVTQLLYRLDYSSLQISLIQRDLIKVMPPIQASVPYIATILDTLECIKDEIMT